MEPVELCREDRLTRQREYLRHWHASHPGKRSSYQKTSRAKRSAAGICQYCAKAVLPGVKSRCEWHWLKTCAIGAMGLRGASASEAASALHEKLIAQNFKCPYTGELLVPGENCWLDHIQPVSRFPELEGDLNNVEWVTSTANRAKGVLTKEEFIQFCQAVLANLGVTHV